jgi:hypothetical protein
MTYFCNKTTSHCCHLHRKYATRFPSSHKEKKIATSKWRRRENMADVFGEI